MQELLKVQDKIRLLVKVDKGALLLALLQGPVSAFFDQRYFEDKKSLEEFITNSMEELGTPLKLKLKTMQSYFEDCVKMVNALHGFPSRDEQYTALVEKCGLS